MEQSKLEAFFNARLPLTDLENIQEEQNLNDSVDLLDNNNKFSSKENEIIIVDEISTDIISKCGGEEKQIQTAKQTTAEDKPLEKDKRRYLSSWEKESVCFYETYIYDIKNIMHEKKICWLYNKKDINGDDRLYCKLCEKYQRTLASNGKINSWCTDGYRILKISKIKQHAASSTHQEAQELELKTSSNSQPNWLVTQNKESKHEVSIQNLILSAIYLCQQDQSINSFEKLCVLMEALGVKLLPAELDVISYRNDNAAIEFLRHVSAYLHEELVEKINKSPSIGWMLDESNSRTVQKSLIIYIRLFESNEAKTKFYGILELDGDGTAHSIVESIKSFWRKDGLNPEKTCWFATDNAATFTANQALFATLESTKFNKNLTVDDRVAAEELLNSILDDQFLFMLHCHYDLHECVLGELTKILQDDDLPYFTMMNILNEKKKILNNWLSQSGEPEPTLGPSLNDYTNSTAKNQSYGVFKIVVGERSQLKNECFTHVHRLLIEIDKRFKPSEVQQYFIVLFKPDHLIQNKNKIGESGYGRQELDFLRIK